MAEHLIDAKGLNCPLPILKAGKVLRGLAAGETLRILATDPGSVADFQDFCRTTGNELVESTQDGGVQFPDQTRGMKRGWRINRVLFGDDSSPVHGLG